MDDDSPLKGINPSLPASGDGGLPLDVAFEALARERRRAVLAVLDRQAGPLPVGAVAETVADRTDAPPGRVAATLHHAHLPKLDAAGLVEYDPEARTVAAGPHFEAIESLLAYALGEE